MSSTVREPAPATPLPGEVAFGVLLEAMPDALVGVDPEGVIRFVNHQAEALFGYDRSALVGQLVEILVPKPFGMVHQAPRERSLADPTTGSMGTKPQFFGVRRDGTEFPLEVSLSHVQTCGGLPVVAGRDMTAGNESKEDRRLTATRISEGQREAGQPPIERRRRTVDQHEPASTAELPHDAASGGSSAAATARRDRAEDAIGIGDPATQPADAGTFARMIGLVIFGLAAIAGSVLLVAARAVGPQVEVAPTEGSLLGLWKVLYATEAPSVRVAVAAVALAALLALGVALLELRITNRSRRSIDAQANPLAPKLVMARTSGVFAGPVTVTVLIPAHDEEASLPQTIASLVRQTPPPERIIVVADNCTDSTVEVARRAGVEVVESVGNTHKKAGALNQVLRQLLPAQGDNDTVMIVDADTRLDDGFLETAVARFSADRALMAIGGLFYGENGAGTLGQFQRNEYSRYSRDIRRRRGRVFVLTGTASMFRPAALRAVAQSRGSSIPGAPGDVYDTAALTEDNELTIALKSLGALMISPNQCTVVTEVMPSWRALWNQRLRWQRGALENLGAYGLRPKTFRYWAQQLGIGYGVIALAGYAALIVLTALSVASWVWFPFWMGLGLLFALERVITVWAGGWPARLLAAAILPELVFASFLDIVYLKGVMDILLGRRAGWKHVTYLPQAEAIDDDTFMAVSHR